MAIAIADAEAFLDEAQSEFERARKTKAPEKALLYRREAAEKAWNAVVQVTDAMLSRLGLDVPMDKTAHVVRSNYMLGIGLDNLAMKYSYFADVLHGNCFYFGRCPDDDAFQRLLDEVGQYITDAEELG